ncbi:MAG: permease [Verrucomicrobiae bacterium]|nr:permease [Verrucomicrobiae bacterium]
MSSCCSKDNEQPSAEEPPKTKSCCCAGSDATSANASCHSDDAPAEPEASCCTPKGKTDWLLWISGSLVLVAAIGTSVLPASLLDLAPAWLIHFGHASTELLGKMWWGLVLGIFFVGLLAKVPREIIMGTLGRAGSWRGLLRATAAGLCFDLCSHGILLVGMQLYRRGASLGQTAAFLIASPWNSFSLTLILVGLIGLPWTVTFVILSGVVALTAGWMLERLVERGTLPGNPFTTAQEEGFRLWPELVKKWRGARLNGAFWKDVIVDGLKESRMILRWIFFGILLAGLIRVLLDPAVFQQYFGPTLLGLILTLIATTLIEVCSEGSSPIAADLITRAGAPGNAFAFLMAGVATDYTEIMSLKETTRSWKAALFLPLVTVPQTLVLGWILNHFATR